LGALSGFDEGVDERDENWEFNLIRLRGHLATSHVSGEAYAIEQA
jgi:hypothetical protein